MVPNLQPFAFQSDDIEVVRLVDIGADTLDRVKVNDAADSVLGGGLVVGSTYLIGGVPGAGKSTLILQWAIRCGVNALYATAEETKEVLAERADRVGTRVNTLSVVSSNDLASVLERAGEFELLVIDSINEMSFGDYSPGTNFHLVGCLHAILEFQEANPNVTVIIVSHVNGDGEIAGPQTLKHGVKCVLHFVFDKQGNRVLFSSKNRHGPVGISVSYEMTEKGLIVVDKSEKDGV